MTVKEAQKVLRKWAGEQAQRGNDDQCWAYDMAALLLENVEDRSKEMIDWARRILFWASVDVSNAPEYRDGVSYVCREFFRKFAKPRPGRTHYPGDPFHIKGWDYDA